MHCSVAAHFACMLEAAVYPRTTADLGWDCSLPGALTYSWEISFLKRMYGIMHASAKPLGEGI